MTSSAIPDLRNVRSIIPARIRRDGCDLEAKVIHLYCALTSVVDLNEIRVHLVAQLDDIVDDLGLLR